MIKTEMLSGTNMELLQNNINNWFDTMQSTYPNFGLFDIKFGYQEQTWTVMIIYELGENKN
jgi:hypothetical protein